MRSVTTIGSAFSVAILLLSSAPPPSTVLPNSGARTSAGGNPAGNLSAGFPYLLNASAYPAPDQIGTFGSNVSLPRLTETSYDSNPVLRQLGVNSQSAGPGQTYLYELAFVTINSTGVSNIDYSSARLNASLAGLLMSTPNCVVNCTHLPLSWGGAIQVASFGSAKVTGDAIGAAGSTVVIAASSGGVTKVWASTSYGENNTWVALLSGGSVSGGMPELAVQPAVALLTTISSGTLEVTQLQLPGLGLTGLLHAVTPGTLWAPAVTFGMPPGKPGPPSPPPTVTRVTPSTGPAGNVVTITGTNYASGAVAFFGTSNPAFTTFLNSTTLQAVVPGVFSRSSLFNVSVCVSGLCSSNNFPSDQFTFAPSVYQVTPSEGLPGITVNVTGVAFTSSTTVVFGGTPSSSVLYHNPSLLTAVVPTGVAPGLVDVTVGGSAHPGDQFTVLPPSATKSIGSVTSAQPLYLTTRSNVTEQAVVIDSTANDSIELLTSTNGFSSYVTHWTGHYGVSFGSPLLGTLAATRLQVVGGSAGEVTVADQGPYVFVGYTTREMEENTLQVVISNDSGSHWNTSYLVVSSNGSIDSPQAVATPAGYIYLTWRANGNGGWSVEQQVFSDSGKYLTTVTTVPGVGGKTGAAASSLSMSVDGWQRPLYAWNATNSSGDSVIEYTGAYLSVQQLVPLIWQRFNQSVPADFRGFGTRIVASYESYVAANLSAMWHDLRTSQWTLAQSVVLQNLYPLLSVNRTGFAYRTPSSAPIPCTGSPGTATSRLSNGSGPFTSGTIFEVYAAWLVEAAGCGARVLFQWPGTVAGAPVPIGSIAGSTTLPTPKLDTSLTPYTSTYGSANVTPITINPNAVLLDVQSSFPGSSIFAATHASGCTGGTSQHYYPSNFALQTPPGPSGIPVKVSSATALPNLYLTNLRPNSNGSWNLSATVTFTQQASTYRNCGGTITQSTVYVSPSLGPSSLSFYLNGTYTTYLGTVPNAPPLLVLEAGSTATIYSNFSASVASAVALFSVTEQGGTHFYGSTSDNQGQTTHNLSIPGAPVTGAGISFDAVFRLESNGGSVDPTWPQLNEMGIVGFSRPLWANYTYSFQVSSNPVGICLGPSPVANISATDATLTWDSNESGSGWLRYTGSSGGQYQESAILINSNSNYCAYRYQYQAELHGLWPWSFYTVWVGVDASTTGNPVTYQNYVAVSFQTTAAVNLAEWEAPIDSVTDEGGGALIWWNWPLDFSGYTYDNGSLTYWPTNHTSSRTVVSIPQLGQYTIGFDSSAYGVNLTLLNRSWTYAVSLFMNFTWKGRTLAVNNEPFAFTYARDTSGDGLTDWEKTRGWNVTTQLYGSYTSITVQANPDLYATDGITSDFIEKEFGLNPTSVSTTGDGMLDTWNLTFDLGAGTPALPASGFQYWYENSSYVFNQACPDPELRPPCSFSPLAIDGNNLTATGPSNPGGDNSPWGAEVLWSGTGSGNALSQFEGLISKQAPGSLRAVTGSYKVGGISHRTITVWGKLSWGADPLAWSTPEYQVPGGIPGDGQRVNPLGSTDLNVTINSWSMDGLGNGNGDGVATFIEATSLAAPYYPSGQTDYANYSVGSTSPGGANSYYGTYTTNFQVAPTEQYVDLNFSLMAATSGKPIWDNMSGFQVDLENTSSHVKKFATSSYTLNITYKVSPIFLKSHTMILLPGDNSTLNNLPLGLEKFSGTQDFVLLAINDTAPGISSISLGGIPYVNQSAANGISGGKYAVNLSAGMNNVLVPRSLFLQSPLGQVLLQNRSNVSIQWTPFDSRLESNWSSPSWQARVLGYSNWNGNNFAVGHAGYIKVYSNTNQNCTTGPECGVLPADLAADSQEPSYAIGSIFELNISSATGLSNLTAGLLLNSSGNFTSWLFDATAYLPTLGLSSEVLSSLASSVQFNQGAYGAPAYTKPSPPPPAWQRVGSGIWNVVSGTVVGAFSVAWGWVQAAGSYAAYLVKEVAEWGLAALQQTVSILKEVAAAIVWALDQLAYLILQIVEHGLTLALTPTFDGVKLALNGLEALQQNAARAILSYMNGTGSLSTAEGASLEAFLPLAGFAIVTTAAIDVALGITMPLSISIGVLLSILVGVIISLAGSGTLKGVGGVPLSPIERSFESLFEGTLPTFVSGVDSAMNYTLDNLLGSSLTTSTIQPLPDPAGFVSDVEWAAGAGSFLYSAVQSYETPADVDAQIGLVLSIGSFSLSILTTISEATNPQGGCNDLPNIYVDGYLFTDLVGFAFGIGGVPLDLKGLGATATLNRVAAGGGFVLDLIGLYSSAQSVLSDVACESTATG